MAARRDRNWTAALLSRQGGGIPLAIAALIADEVARERGMSRWARIRAALIMLSFAEYLQFGARYSRSLLRDMLRQADVM